MPNVRQRTKIMYNFYTLILTFMIFFSSSSNLKSEECRTIDGYLSKELKERYERYDVAYFETFSKEQQSVILNNTDNECIHIVSIGSGSYAILLKIQNSNTYLITKASRLECECPDWSFTEINTITGDIPLIHKINSRTYKDINGNEVKISNTGSIVVKMLHSNERYLFDRDVSTGKYNKIRIK